MPNGWLSQEEWLDKQALSEQERTILVAEAIGAYELLVSLVAGLDEATRRLEAGYSEGTTGSLRSDVAQFRPQPER